MNQVSLHPINKRYQVLTQLGHGGMGAVYRALDKLSGQVVALKQVMVGTENLLFASRTEQGDVRLALAHEFRTLATLRHPYIISVLDYGFDEQKQPYFTMDLLDNAQPLHVAGANQPFATKLRMLTQILQALAYLHRRGILHRDLKPANVLVANGQVKVLDFGLSAASGEGRGTSGTLAYMAPEALNGQVANEATDLYAVGVMAYELFAGHHPFHVDEITILVDEILNKIPDVNALDLEPRLKLVLQRLLAKVREDRYLSANEVIGELNIDQTVTLETDSTRESFLQAASFVGRELEAEMLSAALKQMVSGKGSGWLVAGESGVGKSRLLDEIRTQALVSGVLVLRGQAVSEGAKAYQSWREPLRRLSLNTDLSPLNASVLKSLVPDIASLVDRDVVDAPPLEPQAAQDRLLSTIEAVFKQQTQPVMVVLEDLHWTSNENLDVLNRLMAIAKDSPLLLVGSFRDEERPGLPDKLPSMTLLKLKRLSEEGIEKLSVSMLGESGRNPAIVDLLLRETEGNAFFLVEVVRALAEEAGQLDKVGSITLPEHVFTGGVQRIIQRRLERVPKMAQPLMQLAAVAGRALDLELLEFLDPDMDLELWLTLCADSAVLDVHEGHWRFAHDKLRDGLLNSLGDQRRDLHRRVAEAIEKIYPNVPEQAANLVNHWSVVGNVTKERHYAAIAGQEAAARGAHGDAIQFLERAITLYDGVDSPEQIPLERRLAEAHFGLGRFAECRKHSDRALGLMGHPLPKSLAGYGRGILRELGRQALHRYFPNAFMHRENPNEALVIEECRIHNQLVAVYTFTGELPPLLYSLFHSMNLGESIKMSPSLSHVYAFASIIMTTFNLAGMARLYGRLGVEIAAKINDLSAIQLHYEVMGMYKSIIGSWSEAEVFFDKAVKMTEKTGNHRYWGESLGLQVVYQAFRGQFEGVKHHAQSIIDDAVRNGDSNTVLNALLPQMAQKLRDNQVYDAVPSIQIAQERMKAGVGVATDIWAYGMIAVVHARMGNYNDAQQAADLALKSMRRSQPTGSWTIEGIEGVIETYLTLWQKSSADAKKNLEKSVKQALGYLSGYARFFPIGRARNARWQGKWKALNGKTDAALKLWEKGIASAKTIAMPYDEGLLHFEIGAQLNASNPARKAHLEQAIEIFKKLGAQYELEQAYIALEGSAETVRSGATVG